MEPTPERMIREHRKTLDGSDPSELVLDVSDYQIFSDVATVVAAPCGTRVGSIVVWNLAPGQENDYHKHPDSEHLQYVMEGELEYTLGDAEPRTLRPGQIVIIPAGVPHGIRNVSDQRATYVAITSVGDYEKILVERPESNREVNR